MVAPVIQDRGFGVRVPDHELGDQGDPLIVLRMRLIRRQPLAGFEDFELEHPPNLAGLFKEPRIVGDEVAAILCAFDKVEGVAVVLPGFGVSLD